MKGRFRLVALIALAAAAAGLVVAFSLQRVRTPLASSLAPGFELAGVPIKALDGLVTRLVPVSELDEAELGEVLRRRYEAKADADDPDYRYLNELMENLTRGARRALPYRVFIVSEVTEPNAFALAGGVVLVTSPLLDTVASESELASILAHEVGHIDLGHCLDAVRFQLVTEKVGLSPLGEIADFALSLLLRTSFSKTQEAQADEYAWAVLLDSPYDPRGVGRAFGSLRLYLEDRGKREAKTADPLRDYFLSHPPLAIREAEFSERAEAWWRAHPDAERRVGQANLWERATVYRALDD